LDIDFLYSLFLFVEKRRFVSKELRKQIEHNLEETRRSKHDTKQKEKDQMERLKMEMELANVMNRADHLSKQKEMLEAWERDGHIRNVKKLQEYGKELVVDYIDRNLGADLTSSTMRSPSMNQSLNMSIGYDSRKGKI
jgi:vacuolar-type H+-ATPase subunit I/STV1